jgi:hypothetical protein
MLLQAMKTIAQKLFHLFLFKENVIDEIKRKGT